MKTFISILLASLALLACNNSKRTSSRTSANAGLAGTWELNYISGTAKTFGDLFPAGTPTIQFDLGNQRVSGHSGCNTYAGSFFKDGNKISFTGPFLMTKKMCAQGLDGENTYMDMLGNVSSYQLTEDTTLHLLMADKDIMRFHKKQ